MDNGLVVSAPSKTILVVWINTTPKGAKMIKKNKKVKGFSPSQNIGGSIKNQGLKLGFAFQKPRKNKNVIPKRPSRKAKAVKIHQKKQHENQRKP